MTDSPRLLGPNDEPQQSGAVVAVHYGDYRMQEIWVSSGANIGNWYPLGGEFGRPQVWDNNVPDHMWAAARKEPPPRPAGTVPLHPTWSDVLNRGPVTLLMPVGNEAYTAGWLAGRRDLWQGMEDAIYDNPRVQR